MTHLASDEALALWSSIARDECDVVDSFELDGRMYIRVRARAAETAPTRPLSERETQVLAGVGMGHANKAIAYDLGLSESTVSAYVRRAAAKIGTTSRVGLVRAYAETQKPSAAPRAA